MKHSFRTDLFRTFLVVCLLAASVFAAVRSELNKSATTESLEASAIESCEIGNQSRVNRIQDLRRDIAQLSASTNDLRGDIDLLLSIPPGLFNVEAKIQAKRDMIETTVESITFKRDTIQGEIESVADTAVVAGSPISNCEERTSS